uniref:Serine/threonine/tyrosine interacting like 1 n=1 Tax=Dromaius novaehollandiae TaxID=8790 RepID=A0A8C4P6L1_DRONO
MPVLSASMMRAILLLHARLNRALQGSILYRIQRSWSVSDTVLCMTARPALWISVIMRKRRVKKELDNLQPYPVEILPAKLYMGNFKQACDRQILKDLKIKAQVNISEQPAALFAEDKLLHISVPDSPYADLFSSFPTICHFIDAQLNYGAVLVFSSLGISRSSTVAMAYLMHSSQLSLKEAWEYVRKCKTNMRPNRGFVKQLSDWETQIYGTAITDISEPNY